MRSPDRFNLVPPEIKTRLKVSKTLATLGGLGAAALVVTGLGEKVNKATIDDSAVKIAYEETTGEVQNSLNNGVIYFNVDNDSVEVNLENLSRAENSGIGQVSTSDLAIQSRTYETQVKNIIQDLEENKPIVIGSTELPITQDDLFKIELAEGGASLLASGVAYATLSSGEKRIKNLKKNSTASQSSLKAKDLLPHS